MWRDLLRTNFDMLRGHLVVMTQRCTKKTAFTIAGTRVKNTKPESPITKQQFYRFSFGACGVILLIT